MKCPVCSKEFTPQNRNKTCSVECRKIRKRKLLSTAVIARRRMLKRKAVEYKGGKCQVCSYARCVEGLDFHHLLPEHKDFSFSSNGLTRSWEKVKNELDKCALLCSNCHREIHAKLISSDAIIMAENVEVFVLTRSNRPKKIKEVKVKVKKLPPIKSVVDRRKPRPDLRKVTRPSLEELQKILWEKPTIHIAAQYGVSDKAIGKWAKSYGLSKPPRGYWRKLGASPHAGSSPAP